MSLPLQSERGTMLSGELYDPFDRELVESRSRARDLCQALNATREGETEARGTVVLDVCPVRIGDYTLFGPGVQILTPLHPMDPQQRRREEYGKGIEIGSDVWVGGGALLLAGVRIGSGAVTGAGSVVTRDVPGHSFAAGNPCRVIRDRVE